MPTLTNRLNLPNFYVKAVEYWSKHHDSQADYSVTELLDTPRRVALLRQHRDEVTEDVAERTWSLLGSAAHKVIESANEEDNGDTLVSEYRMFAEVDGVRISGQCDIYDKTNNTIYDLKTASAWEVVHGVKKERELQLNCYAYLGRREGWQVDGIAAVFLLRDWSQTEAWRNHDYPQQQVVVAPLRLWEDEYAEAFIKERISLHEAAKKSLPYCTAEEQWRKLDVWAVHSEGRKSAHRLLDSEEAANTYAETVKGGFVVHRPGEATRCERYCSVNKFCTQYEAMNK